MKKVIVIASVLFLAGVVFSSCKSHEKCPAYGKTNSNSLYKKSV